MLATRYKKQTRRKFYQLIEHKTKGHIILERNVTTLSELDVDNILTTNNVESCFMDTITTKRSEDARVENCIVT